MERIKYNFAKIALKEWYFLSKHVSLWNISADICQDRNWIVFLAVEDSNFVKQDCLFPCPNCPTLPRCLDEDGIQPASDSGAWAGANPANEHVVSITIGLLAGWVARCQALNVEGVTYVRSTISWYDCISQTPRVHVDTLRNREVKAEALRSPADVLCALNGAWEGVLQCGIGVFLCFGFLVCWILEPEGMKARSRERVTVYWYSHYTDKMDPITWW